MLKQEWKKLLSNKLMLVVVIAIIAIPTIYTTLFLGSMWDPYGNVDKMPVAVVNQDEPVNYEGETLQVGKEMAENLKEDQSLDFQFTDAETARKGLEKGTYYMVITIPQDFSANAATLTDEKPQKMELLYDTNPGTNYIASKMSATAMEKIESSVREEVTKTYTEAVFHQILKAGEGMQEAADGSGELNDGTKQLADGNKTITENLKTLADSSLIFRDGSTALTEGLITYVDGVSTVNSGTKQLNQGAADLKDGISQLEGKVPELAEGVNTLAQGTSALVQGTESAKQGSTALKEGAAQVDDNMQTLNRGLAALNAATGNLPEQASKLDNGTGELLAGTKKLEGGVAQLQTGTDTLIENTDHISAGLQSASTNAFGQIKGGIQALKEQVDQVQGVLGAGTASQENASAGNVSGIQDVLAEIAAGKAKADAQAAAAWEAAANQTAVRGTDVSYLYDSLNQALESQDIETIANVAREAIQAAQGNAEAANQAGSQLTAACEALNNSGAALTEAGNVMEKASGIAGELSRIQGSTAGGNIDGAFLAGKLEELSQGLQTVSAGTDQAAAGLNQGISENMGKLKAGMSSQLKGGLTQLEQGAGALDAGLTEVKTGTGQLAEAAPELAAGIQAANIGGKQLQEEGTAAVRAGAKTLAEGVNQLKDGGIQLNQGMETLAGNIPTLKDGVSQLSGGAKQLKDGTQELVQGTDKLAANNSALLNGSSQLGDGAKQISDGANLLYEGSQTLGDGIHKVKDGSLTLKESLADGAKQVKETNTGTSTVDMFAAPVDIRETQITTMENNGHAMAPYMMSVALWVGCIAFSLMYPLTKYSGKLKSGTAWWAGKASVLYLTAILQGIVMVAMLHVCDGFEPVEMGKTIAVACLASVAFMSIMYFFTNTLGKVGSFLMLVFMVIQLAGSVGTYPLELSGSFVPYLHDWVPFTYTVEAFRSTIAGGESIQEAVIFLLIIIALFTALTIVEFNIRAGKIKAGKHTLDEWLEERGLG